MKRIWSLFAVLALLCALTIPALAAAGGAAYAEPAAQTLSEEELARSEENTTKAQDLGGGGAYRCGVLWRRAGHGAFCCKGGEQHGRTARGGGADPHVDDDGSCVYRDGHHLCADRGHPDHLRIVTITRKVE